MLTLPQHTSVLIVGAGPSGLMMAAQLLRNGILPVIIDAKKGPTDQSKAFAVQARSMEIYRQMGIVSPVVDNSKQAGALSFNMDGTELVHFNVMEMGNNQTPFPYITLYQQSKNERLLLDYLTQGCLPVYWETSLISLRQDTKLATAVLQYAGNNYTITCDYIVGADGAHSIVRKQAGVAFNGDTYPHRFYLADVKLASNMDGQTISLFLARNGFAGFFPLPEDKSFRIVASLPPGFEEKDEIELKGVLPHLQNITARDVSISHINWFTTYKLHHRMADNFNQGRCYLIGDAAHIHSPVGGQGMNTGLQDAYNLAWKLVAVIKGEIKPAILQTYAQERMPIAKQLLNTTDRIFNLITSGSWLGNFIKSTIMPRVLKYAWRNEKVRNQFFKRTSQLIISYRDSKISLQLGHDTKVKAGDRLPYLEIFDEKKQITTDIHAWCSKPGFTLITLGDISENFLFTLAKWITQNYPGSLNFFHLPPSAKNKHVFDTLGPMPNGRRALIIRPDMHIGFANDLVDISQMDKYLKTIVGFN